MSFGEETIPSISLGAYGSFSDAPYFEPIIVSIPSGEPLQVSSDLVARCKDNFWYINISVDSVFEYRSVEVPFEIADRCPNRNLTETEWRSLGITQSKGWENHWRSSSERNIFLFRRVLPGISTEKVSRRNMEETVNGIRYCSRISESEDTIVQSSHDFVIFPTYVHNWVRVLRGRREIEFSSLNTILDFQLNVLKLALKEFNGVSYDFRN
jgi:cyclin-dependent kinase regulatory subunit CKS1